MVSWAVSSARASKRGSAGERKGERARGRPDSTWARRSVRAASRAGPGLPRSAIHCSFVRAMPIPFIRELREFLELCEFNHSPYRVLREDTEAQRKKMQKPINHGPKAHKGC